MTGAQKPLALSTVLQWITKEAKHKEYTFQTLAHHITPDLLEDAYRKVRKNAAAGVDGRTAEEYSTNLERNLKELHTQLREQRYFAPPLKRVWIPKGDGQGKRPLGLPTLEDKIVQRAVATLLECIYEEDFHEFSYGYRPNKSCHGALEAIWCHLMDGKRWVIDADIRDYFTSINHATLREFLQRRVEDGGILRLIQKWLKAGVLEDKTLHYPEQGTPQGGVISPLLANIYLHYVLDEWFVKEVQPRLSKEAALVRVADDFVICCEDESDARRIMEVLPKRMSKHGLTIHPDKTHLLDFRCPKADAKKGNNTLDFVGFRLHWGKSRRGKWVVQRKTAPKRLRRTMKRISEWCRWHRHDSIGAQYKKLRDKLRGHYNYFGVTGNSRALATVRNKLERQWFKWLNRRGSTPMRWEKFRQGILRCYPMPAPRIVRSVTHRVQLRFAGM